MNGARCLLRRRSRARQRPPAPIRTDALPPSDGLVTAGAIAAAAAATAASVRTVDPGIGLWSTWAVDAYGRPSGRPPWARGELLAWQERHGRAAGVIYLLHFDRPIGDLHNPRGYATHYTGWTLDLPARLAAHAAGRGARLMEVVGEAGIGWQLARIWTGPRARERSLKRSGGAARRCPVCQLIRLGLDAGRPADLLASELGPRVATSPPWPALAGPVPREERANPVPCPLPMVGRRDSGPVMDGRAAHPPFPTDRVGNTREGS